MSTKLSKTKIEEVLLLEPEVYSDDRGFFFESFNVKSFHNATGLNYNFVQDNHSKSSCGVLRGLHYQIKYPQGKLVRVIEGSIFDVAVDIRKGSSSFGEWFGVKLSASNKKQLWIPPNFAHGFVVISESAQVLYKTTEYYHSKHERSIKWNDPSIGIRWPKLKSKIMLSSKDAKAPFLADAELPFFKK